MPYIRLLFCCLIFWGFSGSQATARVLPSVFIFITNYPVCPGEPIIIKATPSDLGTNLTYQWRINGVAKGTNSDTFTIDATMINITPDDIIDCVVTDNVTGQQATSNKLTKVERLVYSAPYAEIFFAGVGNTGLACKNSLLFVGSYIHFNYNYSIADINLNVKYTLEWMVNGVVVQQPVAGYFDGNTLKNGDQITLRVTISGKCKPFEQVTSNALTITAVPSPTVAISSDGSACVGLVAQYKATVTDAVSPTYQWLVNGNKAGTNSPNFSSSTLALNDVVSCKVTSNSQCGPLEATSNQITVSGAQSYVNSVSISSSAVNNFITEGQTVTFTANNSYKGNVNFQWYVNNLPVGNNSPIFTSSNLTLGDKVSCTVTTTDNCVVPQTVTSNRITILMIKPIVIPNAFTPNGDGINDKWTILPLLAYPQSLTQVFNRYGAVVYQSVGYTDGWDGTFNGKPLPVGVYYYIIRVDDKTPPFRGSLSLLR
ncbi:gliding motility-associated C-terminal domain-containing protein [Mucilaginibacter sp. RS28]|uniref:Gliding motility-associated C-terminal domain-containing protein n=1 Tax=Mucilaginibacter straminoryzae TaxID=2932774 RepID=A0A9X2BAL2_9SPHI|nr:gliding motility-associated C-terminal domain-containing protein [Mucilaginibacter straminoryzae]MCJ8211979.1 gliding motility-associated C-terminal domain-containing protein [Mucilaginibacter straminoryzae]